jgi:cytochrome P450
MAKPSYPMPPGPGNVLAVLNRLQKRSPETLQTLLDLSKTYGDITAISALGQRYYLISHPDDIRRVLVDDAEHYHRVPGFAHDRARVLDPAAVDAQRADHKRLRRIIQPTLTPARLAVHVPVMRTMTDEMMSTWPNGAAFDLSDWLSSLTIRVAAKCLFDSDVANQFDRISGALRIAQEYLTKLNRPVRVPIWVPTRDNIAIWRGWSQLSNAVAAMVRERRTGRTDRIDMLTSLIAARDETDGSALTDKEVQNTMIGLLIAGHETTSSALTWAFLLLSQNPAVEAALHAELDRVLDGRDVTADDLPALPYTEAVAREAMRLYPPAWALSRRALAGAQLGPYPISPGAYVFMSPYLTHRDPRFYDQPEQFNPARWLDGLERRNPRFAYFPFGGGGHVCTGQFFAWLEMQTMLAQIASRWRLVRADSAVITPYPLITMRPKEPLIMRPQPRIPVPYAPEPKAEVAR